MIKTYYTNEGLTKEIEEDAIAEYRTESVAFGSCSVLTLMKEYVGLPPKPA